MANIKRHLTQLEAAGLIRLVQTHPELEFMFRHALVQEAAYNSLLLEDRKRLHLQVGEALESTYPDQLASLELAPVLADHFAKAEDNQRAQKYFTLAGDAAVAVYANSEAVNHYTHALEMARHAEASSEDLTYIYTHLGRALELSSQFDQALTTYKEMEKLAQERKDRPLGLVAMIAQVTLYATPTPAYDPVQGQTLGEQTLTLARELGDQAAEAKLLWILSLTYFFTNDMSRAIDYGERSLALARQLNLREQMAFTLSDLGTFCYDASGRLDQAKAVLAEASDLWRELGNLPLLANSLASFCTVCVNTGEYDQAIAFSGEALQISQSIGNLWGQSYSQYRIGYAYWQRGQPDRAIALMEASLRLSELSGFFIPQIETRADLAIVYGGLGAIERGLELAYLALTGAETRLLNWRPCVLGVLAHLHLWQDNLTEAMAVIDEGKKAPNLETNPYFSIHIILAESELALRQGDYERAIAVTETFLTNLRQFGAFTPQALYLQGQALLGLGQDEAARERLLEARAKAEAVDARRPLWPILFALSQLEPDPAEAKALRQQAREIIEYITDHTPEDLKTSFLDLPDVREVLVG